MNSLASANANTPWFIKAIAIDLDGTLVDSLPDLASAANNMLSDFNLPTMETVAMKGFVGNGIAAFVKRALVEQTRGEPNQELFDSALVSFEQHYAHGLSAHSHPYSGVVEGLIALGNVGFRLACVTNKVAAFTLPLLRDTGLMHHFDLIVSGDQIAKKKPDPEPLLHTCRWFGIQPNELLMIGDSSNDTLCARAAGCPVFCVPYGYSNCELSDLDQDAIISTLGKSLNLITLKA